ncbi:N-acetylmuramoyl-L-alanine amidase [Victivallis vadensis]|uniref:N-acetylmuramoyl-L-alanine amidase family protein n=2 Tax=Victivallis vadensis TaxID=172901 RepID=UPI00307E0803
MKQTILLCGAAAAVGLTFAGCHSPVSREIRALGVQSEASERSCTLRRNGNFITIYPGSLRANFNGGWVHLVEPAQRTEGKSGVYSLSEANLKKVVAPLLNREVAPAKPVRMILIDPGHGGSETGATGAKHQEKTLNFALAQKIRDELVKRGFTVKMTRDTDKDVSLDARGNLSGTLKADLFISVHHNAAGNRTGTGVETFAMTPDGCRSTGGGAVPKQATLSNRYDGANLNLAQEIQSRLVKATGGPDRGVKFARFRVLVKAHCPAVLVEAGFITTPKEELAIADPARQRKVAAAVADGVEAFNRRTAAMKK